MSTQTLQIYWQAHRGGGAHEAPDNTMAANRYAWSLGGIPEADVRTTKDGVIICLHDATLNRTTNASDSVKDQDVAELTFAEIRCWEAGADHGGSFHGEKVKVPSLEEVFAEMQGHPDRLIYLDLKDADLASLGQLIERYGVNKQVIFAHNNQESCKTMKSIASHVRSMQWIGGSADQIRDRYEAVRESRFEGLDQVQFHLHMDSAAEDKEWRFALDREFLVKALRETRDSGIELEVFPYGFDERSIHQLLDLGIRWFATDEPTRFLKCTQTWRAKPTILLTAPFYEEDLRELETFGHVVYQPWKLNGRAHSPEQVLQYIREAGADALIVEHDVVTAEVLEQTKLQWVGVCRGTPSNVDVTTARRLGIPVFVTPARNAQAVTEYVIGELITMLRKVNASKDWLNKRKWNDSSHESYLQHRGSELAGKTVGLVGMGGVGRHVARFLKYFGCKIQFYDPYLQQSPDDEYVSLDLQALFRTSDIVSVHLPVT